jgi:hypothetical protein
MLLCSVKKAANVWTHAGLSSTIPHLTEFDQRDARPIPAVLRALLVLTVRVSFVPRRESVAGVPEDPTDIAAQTLPAPPSPGNVSAVEPGPRPASWALGAFEPDQPVETVAVDHLTVRCAPGPRL